MFSPLRALATFLNLKILQKIALPDSSISFSHSKRKQRRKRPQRTCRFQWADMATLPRGLCRMSCAASGQQICGCILFSRFLAVQAGQGCCCARRRGNSPTFGNIGRQRGKIFWTSFCLTNPDAFWTPWGWVQGIGWSPYPHQ